jgi:hypothetical protein
MTDSRKRLKQWNPPFAWLDGCWILAMITLILSVPAFAGSGPEKDALAERPEAAGGWKWKVGLGAAYRNLGDIEFHGGSFSSSALLPVPGAGTGLGIPSSAGELGIGPLNSFSDRTYLDGYVFIDGQTANPNSFLPGTTAYWGYNSNGQVRNGNLYFSGGEYTTSSLQSSQSVGSTGLSDDFEGVSPVLEFEGMYAIDERWSVGFFSSFLFNKADTNRAFLNFSASQSLTSSMFSVTDRYDLQGVIPPLAPYAGTLNPPGTAPLIDNIPAERIVVPSGTSVMNSEFSNSISQSLRISLYTFSLGPNVAYVVDDFRFSGSLGLAVNIADVKAGYNENLQMKTGSKTSQVAAWQAGNSDTDVIPGFFIQGAAGYRISPAWEASMFGRYDWSDSVSGSVGPSSYSVGLSGYTLGFAVTHTF